MYSDCPLNTAIVHEIIQFFLLDNGFEEMVPRQVSLLGGVRPASGADIAAMLPFFRTALFFQP
jgi:hypothetical protein